MKKLLTLPILFFVITTHAQTTDDLLKQDEKKATKEPVTIFYHNKVINANTTETVGKGKMDFIVTHNFDDIVRNKFYGQDKGGFKNFFGLDNTTDVRIGFHVGLGKNFDAIVSRVKGAGNTTRIIETGFKWRWLQQTTDNSTPLSIALFVNNAVSTMDKSTNPADENYFADFSDRNSQVFQLIAAKRIGKVSLQLSPTFLTQGRVIPNDDKNLFAFGAAIRFPVSKSVNIIADYFLIFRSQSSKDSLFKNNFGMKFYNPLGIGVEILTGGHVFHLNFTNAREILENRFLARTISSWGKGQFRWGFNLSRTFSLWRPKS
jgi:hypothetical protein